MNRTERLIAHVGIMGVLAGIAAASIWRAEMFPFSHYPMYSRVTKLPVELGKVVGVVRDSGKEVPFEIAEHVYPFSERTLRNAMARFIREDGHDAASRALADQLAIYNARRTLHGGPELAQLRYYTMVLEPHGDGELSARPGQLIVETP